MRWEIVLFEQALLLSTSFYIVYVSALYNLMYWQSEIICWSGFTVHIDISDILTTKTVVVYMESRKMKGAVLMP